MIEWKKGITSVTVACDVCFKSIWRGEARSDDEEDDLAAEASKIGYEIVGIPMNPSYKHDRVCKQVCADCYEEVLGVLGVC